MLVCPVCSHENRAGAAFCEACGTRLGAEAAPALAQERKVVTALSTCSIATRAAGPKPSGTRSWATSTSGS
jgi:uncharacterized membrane protein YvbJ